MSILEYIRRGRRREKSEKGEEKGEEKGRRRRGGEMKRGIIVGGMALLLVLGCNNGVAELEKKNTFLSSLANLGNDFLNVFTSFGDMISGETLGFKADSSKKEEIGKYFRNIEKSLTTTKTTLEKIVDDMKKEGNPNVVAAETAVNNLVTNTINKIISGASEAIKGSEGPELIGNIDAGDNGGAVGTGVDNLISGINSIVEVVLQGKGNADAGDNKKAVDGNAARNNDGACKLFDGSTGASGDDRIAAADAAKAVGAVTGADILRAISKGDSGNATKFAKNSGAIAGVGVNAPNDATIAGAIALRAMTKGGKFANGSNASDAKKIVERAAVSAVTKALDTLTIAIRKKIDEGLKTVKEAMKINASDNTITSEISTAAK